MISVPNGTGDIANAMISASQMIYALRMGERIVYHICKANISCGSAAYHIARAIYHSLSRSPPCRLGRLLFYKSGVVMWYTPVKIPLRWEFSEGNGAVRLAFFCRKW